ncbi:MAG: autotransporter-associated beta strand repeat-containing protein [Candidatus Didemnitutus sp.]|nr:autotransporter-associated beta strand repeat-containing protein [Candidatus Didemnitutus sp.]
MESTRRLFSRPSLLLAACTAALFAALPAAHAQYQITTLGATITENFDTFASVTGSVAPTFSDNLNVNTTTSAAQRGSAWSYFIASNTGATITPSTNFQNTDIGNGTTGSFRAYGANTTSDKALGILGSGSFGTHNGVSTNTNNWAGTAATFTNVSGGTITSLVITYTGEQWRANTSRASFINVGYSVVSAGGAVTNAIQTPLAGMTFNALNVTTNGTALNGDDAANRVTYTTTLTGLSIANGASIHLGFAYAGGAEAGSRQGLAIDDLIITASGNAAAASLIWSGASGDTWNTSATKFSNNATAWNNTTHAATVAEFGGADQTITVDAVTAGGVKVTAANVSLTGGTITNGNASTGLGIDVNNASDTTTISSALSTSSGVTKGGAGTLVLSGNQSALAGGITVALGKLKSDTGTIGTKNVTNNAQFELAQDTDGTYSGTLSGAGAFTKSGTGNVTMSTTSTATGSTTIAGGTITAGANQAIASGALLMSSGTTLNLGGFNATISSATLASATINNVGTLTNSGTLTMNASSISGGTLAQNGGITTTAAATSSTISATTLALGSASRNIVVANGDAAQDLVISSNLTSATTGGFVKQGLGTLVLTGDNSGLTGPVGIGSQSATPIDGGTLVISDGNALGTSASTSAFRFNTGVLNVAQALTLGIATSVGGRDNGVTLPTITGADLILAGNVSFFKATGTSGTLHLNVNNHTTITGDLLATTPATGSATSTGAVFGGTGTLILAGTDNSSFSENVTLANTLTVKLQGESPNLLGVGASLTVNADAKLDLNGVNNTTVGALSGSGTIFNNAGSPMIGVQSRLTVGANGGTGGNFSGVIADNNGGFGTVAVTKTGAGEVTFSGVNTYTGGTQFNGGILTLGNAAAAGTTGDFTFGGGTLKYGTGVTTDFSSRIVNSTGPIKINTNGQSITLSTGLAASNTGGFEKLGEGILTFAGANQFTGDLIVRNGIAQTGANDRLVSGVNVAVDAIVANATALFSLDGHNQTIGSLTFGGTGGTNVTNNLSTGAGLLTLGGNVSYVGTGNPNGSTLSGRVNLNGNRTFDVGSSTGTSAGLLVSAVLSGSGGNVLTKTGAGTLGLSGANTYSGGTAINAGTLSAQNNSALGSGSVNIIGGTLSIANGISLANPIAVGSGGILNGTGSFSGAVTVADGGALSGSLSVANGATLLLSSGSAFNWGLNALSTTGAGTNFNHILNAGTVTLNSGALLNLLFNNDTAPSADSFWTANRSWTLISGAGSIAGTSLIVGTPQHEWSNFGTFTTQLNGNELGLVWTAIPEPSTYAVIFGALALLGVVAHRRRQRRTALKA